jgi:Tol biopolymer transport system component
MEKVTPHLSLLVRLNILIGSLGVALIGLAVVIGRGLPSISFAFTARCNDGVEVYIADWSRGLTINLSKPSASFDTGPAWSPTGQQLAFSSNRQGSFEIYIADFAAASIGTLISHPDAIALTPAWSPNGRQIAFVANSGEAPQIVIMDVVTKTIREFSISAQSLSPPIWSPNGQYLAFLATSSDLSVLMLEIATGEIHSMAKALRVEWDYPAWSPDSKWLTFTAYQDQPALIGRQLHMTNVETGIITNLTFNPGSNYKASAWFPDGQHVATVADGGELHIVNIAGKQIRSFDLRVIAGLGPSPTIDKFSSVSISPDGNLVALNLSMAGGFTNYLLNTNTGTFHSISYPACACTPVVWSP